MTSEINTALLKAMVKPADEHERGLRSAVRRTAPGSEDAADGLGSAWQTAGALRTITQGWDHALNALAGQVGRSAPRWRGRPTTTCTPRP